MEAGVFLSVCEFGPAAECITVTSVQFHSAQVSVPHLKFDYQPKRNLWTVLVSVEVVRSDHIGFGTPCDCGRRGPYVHPEISRYSDLKNGDDKINCAGAPEAHDRAIEFLLDRSGA